MLSRSSTISVTPRRKRKAEYIARPTKTKKYKTANFKSGYVPIKATTLAKAAGPFTGSKKVSFVYENGLTLATTASNILHLPLGINDLFNFDKTAGGTFGNKQPLFYDVLMQATGPYRQFMVHSCTITYTIINNNVSPITVFALPSYPVTTEIDSLAEAENFPGVKRLYLTGSGGSKNSGTITVTHNVKDVYPNTYGDTVMRGAYNASPSTIVYGGLFVHAVGSAAQDFYVAVKAIQYATLNFVDAVVS